MLTEYTDCTEFKRLISDKKIKASAIKQYLKRQGIIMTASNADLLSEDVYTIMLGCGEMSQITDMIISEGNYEKSVLVNMKLGTGADETDVLDIITDGFNGLRGINTSGYTIEQPVRTGNTLFIQISYIKKNPGKNKLIQEEIRYIRIFARKQANDHVSLDIRQPTAYDSQRALDILEKVAMSQNDTGLMLEHLNLGMFIDSNKVSFYDQLSSHKFKFWQLETITGITVKRATYDDDTDGEETEVGEDSGTLAGISQAILNGNSLRTNEFVQNSLSKGFLITSIKYRYSYDKEAGNFIISISSKGEDLRIDIEKTYEEEDGKLYIHPFSKNLQNEIIEEFQTVANKIFKELLDKQKEDSK